MNIITRALLVASVCAGINGCGGGGGGDNTNSVFDGRYSGRLSGTSCLSNLAVEVQIEHEVDATGDGSDSEATVVVVDQDGNEFTGPVILTANSVAQIWGFSASAEGSQSEDSPDNIFYNIAHTQDGEAEVDATFIVPEGDPRSPGGCSYTLRGILDKNS